MFSILYLFYNAALLEDCTESAKETEIMKYINNIVIIMKENTFKKTSIKLQRIHDQKVMR